MLSVGVTVAACGHAAKDLSGADCLFDTDCRDGCVRMSKAVACERALAYPLRPYDREKVLYAYCDNVRDDARCCAAVRELNGEHKVAGAIRCVNSCFLDKGPKPAHCSMFDGSGEEDMIAIACERTTADEVCDHLSPARRAVSRARIAEANAERARAVAQNEAKFKAEAEARARAQAARARCEADPVCRASLTPPAPRPTARPTPTPPRTPAPRRDPQACTYTFVTGEPLSRGYANLPRHFYDGPDCAGVCCKEDAACCVDASGTNEVCGAAPSGRDVEPAGPMCPPGKSPRDRRRDDHTPLPLLPHQQRRW
jgi:hypothetical protein